MYLRQMLYRCEVRFLPVIAGYWLNLQRVPNYEELIRMLCGKMLDPEMLGKMLSRNKEKGLTEALSHLIFTGGAETAEAFEERFGSLRIAGTDRILREKMWKNPVSVTEELWYRGLIFRGNRFTENELKACYFLPEDLLETLQSMIPGIPAPDPAPQSLPTRPAIPSETAFVFPLQDNITDIFTLFAALKRDGKPPELPGFDMSAAYRSFLDMLLKEGEFLSDQGEADAEKIRLFLIQNRTAARIQLIRIWRNAEHYDELSENTEALTVRSAPDFDRKIPRESFLQMISLLQAETWWSVSGFLGAVKKTSPDFLRKTFGENRGQMLDSDGNDLSGMGSWYQLEGSWIRFLLFGPLTWLGIVQAAAPSASEKEPTAFRLSSEALFFLSESSLPETGSEIQSKPNLEQGHPTVGADGAVTCSRSVPRYFRYMAARFCTVEKYKADVCTFRITPASLSAAESAGISRESVLSLLKRFTGKALPPALERMLSGTGKNSLPATIYSGTILSVPTTESAELILNTPRLEKWIYQRLNPNSLLIDPKGIEELRRFLMENELFVDVQI